MDIVTFKELFIPMNRLLYGQALRMLRDPIEAEDVVQDIYVRLWERRSELIGIDNPQAYAVTMLKNRCLNLVNSKRFTEDLEGLQIANEPLSDSLELRDRVGAVMNLIGELPDRQRQVIVMHDVDGCPKEEIERVTGLSADNVRQLLSRARRFIRNHFSKDLN
ncbi:sigma-70 family RNA polymerase sigma factor [uncultured Duncaniella sp.]|uniref:RNA polymerase sigma factor n=1 Tax=uncultured Duncaniella sp. TaxID=2768039 RepID=UPI0023D19B2B|nr:sigma-70 family RNA polymerase sigma factor [uncultured Duncaniella sp.]MDE5664403.1 sigma-70 family RNA polymerase sigma factor [Duncaniella sp.]MDE5671763.1 sigma-70 family RNA polymerase sigma factor [Duncaniella sp.]MDE5953280.1 sigma-70 family RNA polymerase sigma factor [Duncaniella sp.]MDE5962305.1 sigma-70 family RNA polymerase sigma factor [Duncaniella sp.]